MTATLNNQLAAIRQAKADADAKRDPYTAWARTQPTTRTQSAVAAFARSLRAAIQSTGRAQ